MAVVGIAGLVIGAVSLVWMAGIWLNDRFRRIEEKLGEHDKADQRLAHQVKRTRQDVKSVKKDVKRLKKKVEDGFADVKELLEKAA